MIGTSMATMQPAVLFQDLCGESPILGLSRSNGIDTSIKKGSNHEQDCRDNRL